MEQLQFKFFWPLTEQIPLDLDYTDCEKPKLSVPIKFGNTVGLLNNTWGSTTLTVANLSLDVETTVIKTKDEPPFYRKALYKLLGLKWEKK